MRVEDIGELTDHGYWRLVYDDCGHTQEFAQEGLKDFDLATTYVRRHFARCLTCATTRQPIADDTLNVLPGQIHLVLSTEDVRRLVDILWETDEHALAQRFARILRQTPPESAMRPH